MFGLIWIRLYALLSSFFSSLAPFLSVQAHASHLASAASPMSPTDSSIVEILIIRLMPLSPVTVGVSTLLPELGMMRTRSGFITSSEEHMMATLTSTVDHIAAYVPDSMYFR